MWPFDQLKVRLKLTLLAGVPVLGTLALATLIARDAQQRAQTAAALGSIEDLAQLTERMTEVVHSLQLERARIAFAMGIHESTAPGSVAEEQQTDRSLTSLATFMSNRDQSKLPPKLGHHLDVARQQLAHLNQIRIKARQPDLRIDEYMSFYAVANEALIDATSALTLLSDDGSLLRSINRLVGALQVIERSSREHALLSCVFGKTEFPPGTFRYFVTLTTEQAVYLAALKSAESVEAFEQFQTLLNGPDAERIAAMRKAALETTEEALAVNPKEWFEIQNQAMQRLRQAEQHLATEVRQAASKKVHETRRAIYMGMGLAGTVIGVSILIGWAIARSMTQSVRALADAAATVQKKGDFSVRAVTTSNDELGILGDAFNGMLAGIQDRDRELQHHRENLEALIDERTKELSERNEEMRLVLDTVEQGLAMVDSHGRLKGECSRAFVEYFGFPQPGTPFSQAIARDNALASGWLDTSYAQLMENVLPVELSLDQMPKILVCGDRQYSLSFTVVSKDNEPVGALLGIRDISAEVAARRAEAAQREQIRTFQRVMRDRFGFLEFFNEARSMVEQIAKNVFATQAERMRTLHTLKGNSAVFDVLSVSETAHELEQALIEGEQSETQKATSDLLAAWDEFASRVVPILGEDLNERVEVTQAELDAILRALKSREEHVNIERLVVRLQREPASLRFKRIEDQLVGVARRLGKPIPEINVVANDVRIPMQGFREFWSSFAHVVRNLVDHGLETESERIQTGKPSSGRVQLRATSDLDALTIEISDDGRGIDWAKIGAKAQQAGLSHETGSDLVEALFSDGISTATRVTQTAGRGVGMSAVRAVCSAMHGKVEVESERGKGTLFRFEFPPIENESGHYSGRLSMVAISEHPHDHSSQQPQLAHSIAAVIRSSRPQAHPKVPPA